MHRGTVITTPKQGVQLPAHSFEAPIPRTPQEFQEFNDDDQEDEDLYDPFDPVPDDFAEKFNAELFREQLAELLSRETESKDVKVNLLVLHAFKPWDVVI